MTTLTNIRIELGDEELERLAALAQRRGHKNITEYIRYLVNEDANLHDEASPVDDDDVHIREGLRQGMKDAIRGKGRPAREVLAELDEDGQA